MPEEREAWNTVTAGEKAGPLGLFPRVALTVALGKQGDSPEDTGLAFSVPLGVYSTYKSDSLDTVSSH